MPPKKDTKAVSKVKASKKIAKPEKRVAKAEKPKNRAAEKGITANINFDF